MADWHQLRFLESVKNLKPRVRLRFGREPSTRVALEIVACLLQGRLFYEAASSAPLEIRPLQLFYGMVGFAKALIVASRCRSLATLRAAHGLSDISGDHSQLTELRVRIGTAGTFQEFNDVVGTLNRFCFYEGARPMSIRTPAAMAERISDFEISLQDILSRIPTLETLYRRTFGGDANSASLFFSVDDGGICSFRLDDPELFTSRESLQVILGRWRLRFPFLQPWRIVGAEQAWGKSTILLQNISNETVNEFSEDALVYQDGRFTANQQTVGPNAQFLFTDRLAPMAGGFTGADYAIAPVNGQYLSELSLHYLGMFLLSSLVRYRPQAWVQAISRSSTTDAPADDQALSLIERFLEYNSNVFPNIVTAILNPDEDRFSV